MQGQGKNIGSFPETIDVGQGSGSNGAGLSQQTSFNNLLAPVENRWSSFVSSSEACLNASNIGESTGSVMQNQVNDEGMKIEHGRSSSYSASRAFDPMSEERQFETTSILFPGRTIISLGGNQVRSGPSQGSSSNHIHQNVNLNVGNNSDSELGGASGGPNLYMSSGTETYQTSGATASSDIIGTSSGSSGFIVGDSNDASGSLSNWGLSGKRKVLEGTSGQSSPGGSSSSFPQAENYAWHTGSARYNPSSSLRLSVPSCNSPTDSLPEQRNPRTGVASRTVTSFPSSSGTVNLESPLRQFGSEFETGSQQDSVPFNLTSSGDAVHSSFCSPHQSARPFTSIDSLDTRASSVVAANSAAPHIQPHISSFPGNMHPLSWNGASNSRVGSMSNSLPGERGTELREEANLRSIPRSNVEQSMFVSANELRSSAQDPTNSSLATGNISTSLGIPSSSSSRIGSSSSTPSWIPPHNPPTQNRQRTLEFAPWSLFPSIDSQPGGRSGHLNPLLPGPSSSQDTTMASGRNNHNRLPPSLRSSFLLDRQGEDVLSMSNSLRVLSADIEGRRRLISEQIRQVLNAMRRGENLQAEDYMLFDPFIYHGMAEIHDRHRDMRLDVDNMSYEELLALEERIGDVSTGLTETTILKLMKQRKFASFGTESGSDIEPCCICQEEYADGDEVGALDCGHDFHTDCVKQWLMQKNLCPICKTTGLLS